jgi:hypothetical protein
VKGRVEQLGGNIFLPSFLETRWFNATYEEDEDGVVWDIVYGMWARVMGVFATLGGRFKIEFFWDSTVREMCRSKEDCDEERDGELVANEDGEGREQRRAEFFLLGRVFHTVRLTTNDYWLG